MPLKIETWLPDAFFGQLGRYVAICGHIEYLVWLIAVKSKAYDLDNQDDVNRILKLRKSTAGLVKELEESAKSHVEPVRGKILEIAGKLDRDGRDPRDMAIHGTWCPAKEGSGYKVMYWRDFGTSKATDWKSRTDTISDSDLDEAVTYVDRLHRELIEIAMAIGILPNPVSENG